MNRFFLLVLPLVGCLTGIQAQVDELLEADDTGQQVFDYLSGDDELSADAALDRLPQYNAPNCLQVPAEIQDSCRLHAMLIDVYQQIRYPAAARRRGIQGQAVISFVVERDGSLSTFSIEQDPGRGIGEEALRAVRLLGRRGPGSWLPGIVAGRPVRVIHRLPINFQLE